ncbi:MULTISPECIES: PotD/PotF family extracellular solute-binding protein [Micromonospora]|uniref:Spermidine/putrescine ABC transporter substrate-binding protein n=1 Tax=Micromonospora solifontis TaxID=2487138 RepID=A0ABX9WJD9_9ACTN|nr:MULTISPECIES: spermidine/putrescine ABC transporter substrate-binding protein [Micromonospora]NES15242.1 spermidine/putrescine ABC transporter substrate-binding protein [Micromonospora sp. PPF5-17B]NES36514.1 spermidine/putrescine ABC transporter substrate-binding protein [Micromonospora solifontis]NES56342.1 spermidine/putrescine ABC transporter substrate-binding protein [Micromonospora sp. PPF5-6]RNL99404.1 spermidine/putrescine ABC transporter substrate-binding protein [Micromonospora sol
MRSPHRSLTRRGLLTGTLGSAALLATAGTLAGCGTKGAQQTEAGCKSDDLSATEKKLAFSNWPQYMDVDEKDESKRPTLDAFVAKSGIQVTYTEDVNDNNEFFGKVQNQLAGCQPTGRDVMVLTDWMAARMIRLGWIQKLDKAKLPNVEANLLPSLRNRPFDSDNQLAIPWQSGLAGIAYNGKHAKEIRTVDELLTKPELKGKVTALSEMRDTMGLLLQASGHDPANFTAAQFDDALAKLKRAVDSGQIRKFTGNEYSTELAKGDIVACIAWSGDVIQLGFDDDKIKFVVPESGVMLWSDNMLVPNRSSHKANAEELINYYYDPAVAAKLAAYVNYICPVKGAQAEMEKIDPDLAGNPLIFPDEAMLSKSKVFMALDEKQEKEYETKFQQVIGA